MVAVTRRPEREKRAENEEKTYKSKTCRIDNGGKNAEVGDYAGETMILMRIYPRMTRIQGRSNPSHVVEGIDPATGESEIVFFDTRLKEDGSYVRNFGGGLAEMLGQRMTFEEFEEITEVINSENGTDFVYDFAEWEPAGGALKLKEKYYGKLVTIGKECVKTQRGQNMNVFAFDVPEETYANVEEMIAKFENDVGQPPKGAAKSRGRSVAARAADKPVKETKVPEAKSAYESEVARENGKTASKPKKSVEDYIDQCKDLGLTEGAIVACLMKDYSLTAQDAANQVNAAKLSDEPEKPVPKVSCEEPETLQSLLIKAGKECKKAGLTVPDAYDRLSDSFKGATKVDIRNALTVAGLFAR
jgi:hypothetical protein